MSEKPNGPDGPQIAACKQQIEHAGLSPDAPGRIFTFISGLCRQWGDDFVVRAADEFEDPLKTFIVEVVCRNQLDALSLDGHHEGRNRMVVKGLLERFGREILIATATKAGERTKQAVETVID